MKKYKFEYMHPNFNDILSKSLEFTDSLILYIPRNTDVTEICSILSIYADKLNEMGRANEVRFEIERLGHHHGATSMLVIYTGQLADIKNSEIVDHILEEYLEVPDDAAATEKVILDLSKCLVSHGSCIL